MTTANTVKVAVGSPCTLTVSSLTEVPGNYGAQLRFEGNDGNGTVNVYEKIERVDEQLRRCGLDRSSVIGKTITISKEQVTSARGTFPALRIALFGSAAQTANGHSAPAPTRTPQQSNTQGGPLPYEKDSVPSTAAIDRYASCLKAARVIAADQQITDQSAITAIAATLFIDSRRAA